MNARETIVVPPTILTIDDTSINEDEIFEQVTPSTFMLPQQCPLTKGNMLGTRIFGSDKDMPRTCRDVEHRRRSLSPSAFKRDSSVRENSISVELQHADSHCLGLARISGRELAMLSVSSHGSTSDTMVKPSNCTYESAAKSNRCDHVIDVCSCMCCVKGVFYHLNKDRDDSGEENLFTCNELSVECSKRMCFLCLSTFCCPCMLFYPLLKGIQALVKFCKT